MDSQTDDTLDFDKEISTAIPIWTVLKITKEEYIKKYAKPFEFDAKKKEINIDLDNVNNKNN